MGIDGQAVLRQLRQVRKSPVVVLGIPLVCILLILKYGYQPLSILKEELEQVVAARELNIVKINEKMRGIAVTLEGREELEQKLAIMAGRGVEGESREAANSQLERIVTESCTAVGMTILRYSGVKPKPWEGRELLGVAVTMEGQTENLVKLLKRMNEKLPDSRLQSLQILNADVKTSRLSMQLELHSLYFPPQ
jgi:hypothetical protein